MKVNSVLLNNSVLTNIYLQNRDNKNSFLCQTSVRDDKAENSLPFFTGFISKIISVFKPKPKQNEKKSYPMDRAICMFSIQPKDKSSDDVENSKVIVQNNNFLAKKLLYRPTGNTSSYYQDFDYLVEHSSSGDVRMYHNGKLKYEKRADGTIRAYTFNGKLLSEEFPNGLKRTYYPKGSIESETFPNGSKNSYYDNGKLKEELLVSGESYSYDMNGFLTKYSNGTGKVNSFKYDSKGRLLSKVSANGISKKYFANGKNLYEIDSKGVIKRYSPSGKLLYEKSANGTIKVKNKTNKGEMPVTILPDGKVVESKYTGQWNRAYKSFMSAISESVDSLSENNKKKDNALRLITKDLYEQMLNGDFEKIKDADIKLSIVKWREKHPKYNKVLFDFLHC